MANIQCPHIFISENVHQQQASTRRNYTEYKQTNGTNAAPQTFRLHILAGNTWLMPYGNDWWKHQQEVTTWTHLEKL
jgi:hypothetical protein